MIITTQLQQVSENGLTTVFLHILVDGREGVVGPVLLVRGPSYDSPTTQGLGFLDPNTHSLEQYAEALGMKLP